MTPARLGSHPVPARPVPFTIDRAASMPSLLANRPPSFRTSSRGPTIPRTPVCAPAAFAPPTALVTGGRLLPPAAAPTSMCIPLSRFARGGVGLAETTTSGSRAAPRLRPPSRPAGAGITGRGPRRCPARAGPAGLHGPCRPGQDAAVGVPAQQARDPHRPRLRPADAHPRSGAGRGKALAPLAERDPQAVRHADAVPRADGPGRGGLRGGERGVAARGAGGDRDERAHPLERDPPVPLGPAHARSAPARPIKEAADPPPPTAFMDARRTEAMGFWVLDVT